MPQRLWTRTLAHLVVLVLPFSAWATLGEDVGSVEGDRVAMRATIKVSPNAYYTVQELVTPEHTTIKEFVGASGIVFAVAWQGPVMPDLRQILGGQFDRYVQAAAAKHPERRHVAVTYKDLVVESGGHMRAFSGRAYLPLLLPAGVTAEEIR